MWLTMRPIVTKRPENLDSRYLASSAHPAFQITSSLVAHRRSRDFHPRTSFQTLRQRLSLRPGKCLLRIVYPGTKYDLIVKVADVQAFQNILTIKLRRLRSPCPTYAGI